ARPAPLVGQLLRGVGLVLLGVVLHALPLLLTVAPERLRAELRPGLLADDRLAARRRVERRGDARLVRRGGREARGPYEVDVDALPGRAVDHVGRHVPRGLAVVAEDGGR